MGILLNNIFFTSSMVYVVMGIASVVAMAFGSVWYLKTKRNASFPLIENFVYNRMSE